jgi:hypothetical protein
MYFDQSSATFKYPDYITQKILLNNYAAYFTSDGGYVILLIADNIDWYNTASFNDIFKNSNATITLVDINDVTLPLSVYSGLTMSLVTNQTYWAIKPLGFSTTPLSNNTYTAIFKGQAADISEGFYWHIDLWASVLYDENAANPSGSVHFNINYNFASQEITWDITNGTTTNNSTAIYYLSFLNSLQAGFYILLSYSSSTQVHNIIIYDKNGTNLLSTTISAITIPSDAIYLMKFNFSKTYWYDGILVSPNSITLIDYQNKFGTNWPQPV